MHRGRNEEIRWSNAGSQPLSVSWWHHHFQEPARWLHEGYVFPSEFMPPKWHIPIPHETNTGRTNAVNTKLTSDTAKHPREINVCVHQKTHQRVFIAALLTDQDGKTQVSTIKRRTDTKIEVERWNGLLQPIAKQDPLFLWECGGRIQTQAKGCTLHHPLYAVHGQQQWPQSPLGGTDWEGAEGSFPGCKCSTSGSKRWLHGCRHVA